MMASNLLLFIELDALYSLPTVYLHCHGHNLGNFFGVGKHYFMSLYRILKDT